MNKAAGKMYGERPLKVQDALLNKCPDKAGEAYYIECFRPCCRLMDDPGDIWLRNLESKLNIST